MRLYKVAILQDVAVSHPQVRLPPELQLVGVLSELRYESITSVASQSPLTSAAIAVWPADLMLHVPISTSFIYLRYVLSFSLYISSCYSIAFPLSLVPLLLIYSSFFFSVLFFFSILFLFLFLLHLLFYVFIYNLLVTLLVTQLFRVSEKNSGVLFINIYSLLWHKNFWLTKTIRESLQVLLPLSAVQCEHHWLPYRRRN
jgi:hypothetical protein